MATLKKGDNRFTIDTQICGSISQPDAAEKLNVSVRNVQRATKVIAEAEPEIVQAVEDGAMT